MDDTTDKYCNYKTTDCTVNTRDLYKGLNLPKRFECPCEYDNWLLLIALVVLYGVSDGDTKRNYGEEFLKGFFGV